MYVMLSAKARELIGTIDEATDRVQSIQADPRLHSSRDMQYERMRLGQARRALELYIAELESERSHPTLEKIGR